MSTIFVPTVGHAYKFTFESRFSAADGIYRVERIYTYDEFLLENFDIGEGFYEVCGLKKEDAAKDYLVLRNSMFLKLKTQEPEQSARVAFCPLCYVTTTPDHNIKKYTKYGLIVYAGITDTVDRLEYLRKNVEQMFNNSLGVDSQPYWVSISSQWMTEDEYGKILQAQDIAKNKVLNYYSENLRLQRENSSLATKVSSYEEIIIKLQRELNDLKAQRGQSGGTD